MLKSEIQLNKIKELEIEVEQLTNRIAAGEKKESLLKLTVNSLTRHKKIYEELKKLEQNPQVTENKTNNGSVTENKTNNGSVTDNKKPIKGDKKYTQKEVIEALKTLDEYEETDNLKATMYVTKEGKQIGFGYEYGSRLNDHRIIFSCFEDIKYNDFNSLIKNTELLMVMPETEECFTLKNKKLSKEQKAFIKNNNLILIRE